ncbi:hypothetical protein BDY21DRAFT_329603 [Lineolata rhizophorae]|uniref:Uncharacterized protein n=1 Tax=Lineolata rhizophorae TaxID=578093 RepID=A0A6A6PD27_9PEZI|nr:hypothetical protein BDY21DRAFT_329603 [Lineolata rhizophorae]
MVLHRTHVVHVSCYSLFGFLFAPAICYVSASRLHTQCPLCDPNASRRRCVLDFQPLSARLRLVPSRLRGSSHVHPPLLFYAWCNLFWDGITADSLLVNWGIVLVFFCSTRSRCKPSKRLSLEEDGRGREEWSWLCRFPILDGMDRTMGM